MKIKLLLLTSVIALLIGLSSYNFRATVVSLPISTKTITGAHSEIDEIGNQYYYSNSSDIPELGDFRGHYKNGSIYKREFEGVVEEETLNFITLDQDISGVEGLTVIFCIEPNEIATWVDGTDKQSNHYQDLTSTQQKNVNKIVSAATSLFSSTGNYDYLSAGQLLVWEAVGTNLITVPSNINEEMSQIRNIVENYDVVPSFLEGITNPKFELTYNSNNSRYEVYLQDTNHILDEHFLSSMVGVQGNFHIEDGPNSDDLYIWTASSQLATQVITAEYNVMPLRDGQRANIKYKTTPTFINSGQDLVSGISYEKKIQFDVYTKQAKGSAKLKKCGYIEERCEPLKGAVFGLYNESGDLKNQKITDEGGEIEFSNLSLGKYYVKEIYAPNKYKLNDVEYSFEITDDGQEVLINDGKYIENELVKGTVSLKKVGIKNNNDTTLYPLEGVEFTIYIDKNGNGKVDSEDNQVDKLITDENGEIHSKELEYGSYIIRETQTIEGYINNAYEEAFTIKSDNENIELLGGMDLVNDIKKGKVDLIKEGEDLCNEDVCDSIPLQGVEFIVYKDENSNQEIDEKDVQVETLITDSKGYAKSNDLIYGDYIIKEIKTNPGYEMSLEEYPFFISGEEDVHLNQGSVIINNLKTKYIDVNKKDQFGNPIEGVEFIIYEDIDGDGKISNEDAQIETLITDSEGNARSGELAYGNYIICETSAPKGYIINFEPYPFIINDETYNEELVFNIINELIVGDVKIIKKDNENNKVLSGVSFELYKDENNNGKIDNKDKKVGIYITDENGEINIYDLPYGDYLLKENKAKDGYYLSNQIYKIEVDGSLDTYEYEIYNQKIKERIVETLVNTSKGVKIKFIITMILTIIVLFLIIKSKIKKCNYI